MHVPSYLFSTVGAYITNPPNDTTVHVGDDALFRCVATSEPAHSVLWLLRNQTTGVSEELTDGEKYIIVEESEAVSVLMVVDVTPYDAGEYTCDVQNAHGDDTGTAVLTVICKTHDSRKNSMAPLPPILCTAAPVVRELTESPAIAELSSNVTLSFEVMDAIPPVQLSSMNWIGEGFRNLSLDNPRFYFSDDFTSLTIFPVDLSDEGTYTLTVTNVAGTDSASIELDVECKSTIILLH